MPQKLKVPLLILLGLAVAALIAVGVNYLHGHTIAVLQPAGTIGQQERSLMLLASLLAVVIVAPVFVLTAVIVWRYRDKKSRRKKPKYTPDNAGNNLLEAVWWLVPLAIIAVLSVVTWQSSHALDPFRPLAAKERPLQVQVVALQWRWLFIYPEQGIATTNLLELPVNRPINFQITSDAPMNSFWIPQLGGQVYAMSGMSTQLHLMAGKTGDYRGVSANLSGEGFAGMHFTARAVSSNDFNAWVQGVRAKPTPLTAAEYAQLRRPLEDSRVLYYSAVDINLYDTIVMKYMGHSDTAQSGTHMEGMHE